MDRAEERLLNPPPGGRIEAARAHGVGLSLLVERLRRTPEERVRDLERAAAGLEAVRGKAWPRGGARERPRPGTLRRPLREVEGLHVAGRAHAVLRSRATID